MDRSTVGALLPDTHSYGGDDHDHDEHGRGQWPWPWPCYYSNDLIYFRGMMAVESQENTKAFELATSRHSNQ